MAIPTEENPPGESAVSGEEVKIIAIKLPFDLQERLLTFPFLHALRGEYPQAEIHFITPKWNIEILNLLPFKAYYHEFEEKEINSLFDVHRYCANAKIYNVDLFVSLTNSFVDACLGMGLRARKRLGFSDGWKSLVLTDKTTRPLGHHICEDFFSLFKTLTGKEADAYLRVMSRDLKPIIEDWDSLPYIAVNISPLRNASLDEGIIELISQFENQKIVLFCSEDQQKSQILITSLLPQLPKQNIYVNFLYPSWIELARMLAYARGVITYNSPVATVAAYAGSRTAILYDRENPKKSGPYYFLSEVLTLDVNDPTLRGAAPSQTGKLRPRETFNMTEVFGNIFEFFKLVIR
jgi:ADP-heptose:LPS heptosyltransferase